MGDGTVIVLRRMLMSALPQGIAARNVRTHRHWRPRKARPSGSALR
jgi:hypothetical protein